MSGSNGASGNFALNALASWPPGTNPTNMIEEEKACKIARAMLSGPPHITKDARVIDDNLAPDGTPILLRPAANGNTWTLMPGNENMVGMAPMCADPHGIAWLMSIMARRDHPENTEPGFIYMLCGATQHSNTDALDKTSPAIPIGPHWMIVWPYDKEKSQNPFTSSRLGIPNTVRDAGAWQMFDNTAYSYTHICGNPWAGNVYDPATTKPVWTMQYQSSS